MSDIVIKVETLGKRYTIGHQVGRTGGTTFREVLLQNARTIWNRTRDLTQGKPVIAGDTLEEVWALKDVSFEIRRGEAVGIIGRNGAGKSTLLKILSRITEPTTGRVTIRGRVASLLEVGTGFHSELSGRENIYLNGTILGMSRAEIKRKFEEIVAFAEVETYLDTPVKRYSSGMYVRLAFAVAAHLEPEILIIDEILAVGDAQFQQKCLGKMRDVGREGRTVLFVSHNMAAVSQLCESGVILERGILKKRAGIEKCVAEYLNLAGERVGTLLQHRQKKSDAIDITKALVNGTDADVLHVSTTDQPLVLEMTLSASEACRVSLYGFLKSSQGQTIGIYSPGHMENAVYFIRPGLKKLTAKIFLPKLTKGTYFLELGLADPGIVVFADFPLGLTLIVEGQPGVTGIVFEENHTNGFLVLHGSVSVV